MLNAKNMTFFCLRDERDRESEELGRENKDSLPETNSQAQSCVFASVCVCVCVGLESTSASDLSLRLDSHLLKSFFPDTQKSVTSTALPLPVSLWVSSFQWAFSSALPLVCSLSSTSTLIYFSLLHWLLGHIFLPHRDVLFSFLFFITPHFFFFFFLLHL